MRCVRTLRYTRTPRFSSWNYTQLYFVLYISIQKIAKGMFKNLSHIVGPFWYPKTILNSSSSAGCPGRDEPAASVAENLRRSMLQLKSEFMSEDGSKVDYDGIEHSQGFETYKQTATQLQHIDVGAMSELERRAFFINVYNSLIIHAFAYGYVRKSYLGYMLARKMLYATASYNIGGQVYSLDDIEHGVLRDNSNPVGSSTPLFPYDSDPRVAVKVPKDSRIHFALNCGAISCPPIAAYKAATLDSDLAKATRSYLRGTTITEEEETTTIGLSRLFYWYHDDFGSTDDELLSWVQAHADEELSSRLSAVLDGGRRWTLSYQDYEWGVNSR